MKVTQRYEAGIDNDKQRSYYKVAELEPGEPIFVLRGRDPLALRIIMDYEQQMDQLKILSHTKKTLLQDLAKDFVKYGATAQLRFPD